MMEKFSLYEFEVLKTIVGQLQDGWVYVIYLEQNYLGQDECIESDEWYDTEQEARFAAIGHIDLLENGEGFYG